MLYSTFRSEMPRRASEREEGRKGEESLTKRTEFTVRDRDGEEGVTSRRDAVGMFSQAEKITCNHCQTTFLSMEEYTYPQRSVSSVAEIIPAQSGRSSRSRVLRILVRIFRAKDFLRDTRRSSTSFGEIAENREEMFAMASGRSNASGNM